MESVAMRRVRVKAFEQDTPDGLEQDINRWICGPHEKENPDTILSILDIKYAVAPDPGFPAEQARFPMWYSALVIYTV